MIRKQGAWLDFLLGKFSWSGGYYKEYQRIIQRYWI